MVRVNIIGGLLIKLGNDYKNQHIDPKFHLKGFCKDFGNKGGIRGYRYLKLKNISEYERVKDLHINDLLSEDYYLEPSSGFDPDNTVEGLFINPMDNELSKIFRCFMDSVYSGDEISEEVRLKMSHLIYIFMSRSVKWREFGRLICHNIINKHRLFIFLYENGKLITQEEAEKDLISSRFKKIAYKISSNNFDSVNNVIINGVFVKGMWKIYLDFEKRDLFYLSDSPVVFDGIGFDTGRAFDNFPSLDPSIGFGTKVIFTLNSNCVLVIFNGPCYELLRNHKHEYARCSVSRNDIAYYNSLHVKQSAKYIISKKRQFALVDSILKTSNGRYSQDLNNYYTGSYDVFDDFLIRNKTQLFLNKKNILSNIIYDLMEDQVKKTRKVGK